jgi:hypothetical protein
MNHKKLRRLYAEKRLQVRPVAAVANERWAHGRQ